MNLRCAPGDGLGNTFLLAEEAAADATGMSLSELAPAVCGTEYDGLLLVGEPRNDRLPVDIVNRDGSLGEACLNGLRVVAAWTGADEGVLEMAGRAIPWQRAAEGIELRLSPAELPGKLTATPVDLGERKGLAIHVWNPHCVVTVDDVDSADLPGLAAAAREHREMFPQGVNVEIVSEGGPGRVRMRVDERGVGETKACGSGALAVAITAWAGKGAAAPLEIAMPGGSLHLAPDDAGGIRLTGAAQVGAARDVAIA